MSSRPALRFALGTEVVCKTSDGWQPGRVIDLWWRDEDFPPDVFMPYQVELENGDLIFVPKDTDKLCQQRVRSWWEPLFEQVACGKAGVREVRAAASADGNDINERDYEGSNALLESLRLGWSNVVDVLLESGASVRVIDHKGRSVLHSVVEIKSDDFEGVGLMVQALLDRRADPNVQDRDLEKDPEYTSKSFEEREKHRTPLHYCAAYDYTFAAAILIEAGANPNIIDSQYKTPLHLAIDEQASLETVELLLASRADPNMGNVEIGMTSSYLMVAARLGNAELASCLINARANLDQVGKQGMTAAHLAARGRHENVARLLVEAKCDTSIKAMGKTAGELAGTNGALGIAKLLGFEPSARPKHITSLDDTVKKDLFLE